MDRSSRDPFFRYRMPPVQTARESGRTALVNLEQVARAVHRDPAQILKYLSIKLGCTAASSDARHWLGGAFDAERIQGAVFDYIDAFVLCRTCRNPETRFLLEGGQLRRSCNSCGAVFAQEPHKINAMVLRDLDRRVNEDRRYGRDASALRELLASPEDVSDRVYEAYRREGPFDLFAEYFRPSAVPQLRRVLAEMEHGEVLAGVERMLEERHREERLGQFLRALLGAGYGMEELRRHFSAPRRPRRSPLIRRAFEDFLEEAEGDE